MAVKIDIKGTIVSDDVEWMYRWLGIPCCSPGMIRRALDAADGQDVVFTINSGGGYATAGFEIYTAIKEYEGTTTAHVIYAASAATFPACAADQALISDAGIFMIHNTQASADGDYRDMQMGAETLEEYDQAIINVYEKKTGMSREELQKLMDRDTHMSPQKAIDYGFIDGYMFAEGKEGESKNPIAAVAAVTAGAVVIPPDKAMELKAMMASIQPAAQEGRIPGAEDMETQNNSGEADSDIENKRENKRKEDETMDLDEFLKENPEARAAFEQRIEAAKEEGTENGTQSERQRIKELDAIRDSVTKDALEAAKYGDNICNAKELAYQAMLDDAKKASNYMRQAVEDSQNSKVNDVDSLPDDTGSRNQDDSDEMAMYINQRRGR